jgi:hypothetical protein
VIETLKDLPRGIDGVKAIGKISKEDYEQVFVPLFDEIRREGAALACYISLDRSSRALLLARHGKMPKSASISCDFSTAVPLSRI